ncbi:MAG: glycosyltransferase [bacterium]|nr:glycosyltransferase [bacterium]
MKSYLITIPAYNEARIITDTLLKVSAYLEQEFPHLIASNMLVLSVAINGSTDKTEEMVIGCQKRISYLAYTITSHKGRGAALDNTWSRATESILLYIDSDLAYSLNDLGNMIRAYEANEDYDLVVASRRVHGSVVKRPLVRVVLTEGYNWFIKFLFFNRFSDAQAGCKSIKRSVYVVLREGVSIYDGWFFDTALLLYAEKRGYKIKDLKITCIDNRKWRLAIVGTILYFVHKLIVLRLKTLIRGYH